MKLTDGWVKPSGHCHCHTYSTHTQKTLRPGPRVKIKTIFPQKSSLFIYTLKPFEEPLTLKLTSTLWKEEDP